jgi:geranylgeranyl reductase family protein
MDHADVAIVGGGPAGSACAICCAAAGLRTIVLERETFPREKVCGDCLNPACWPVLRRMGIDEGVRALPHGNLDAVEFIGIGGARISVALPSGGDREIAVKRSLFDDLLLKRAHAVGADVRHKAMVTRIEKSRHGDWILDVVGNVVSTPILVAADGRNSTVARLRRLLPSVERERIALQTHVPLPLDFGNRVVLQFLPEGYSGQAPVDTDELNLCLVGKARDVERLKAWATNEFRISTNQPWRTITPLSRSAIEPARENLFLIGDAARVVEPFTGEGIYYALRSGELAANAILAVIRGEDRETAIREFVRHYTDMYRGRLWINEMARLAVVSPRAGSALVRVAKVFPGALRILTRKITS